MNSDMPEPSRAIRALQLMPIIALVKYGERKPKTMPVELWNEAKELAR